jgi:hypothetical protein
MVKGLGRGETGQKERPHCRSLGLPKFVTRFVKRNVHISQPAKYSDFRQFTEKTGRSEVILSRSAEKGDGVD